MVEIDNYAPFMRFIMAIESEDAPVPDAEVQKLLQQYPPMETSVKECMLLPNHCRKIQQCSFTHGNVPFRCVEPLVHVFSKAWPMRCSIRNFSDIISKYIDRHEEVFSCILDMLKCTLSGAYYHSTTKMRFPVLKILYKYFSWTPISRPHMSQWIRQGNQQLVFIAIKEYITFIVSMVPGLEDTLSNTYNWKMFSQFVLKQANYIRSHINTCENISDMFTNLKASLPSMKGLKISCATPSWASIVNELIAIVRNIDTEPEYQAEFVDNFRRNVYNKLRSVTTVCVCETAMALNVDPSVVQVLKDAKKDGGWRCKRKEEMRMLFSALDFEQQYILHEFINAWSLRMSTGSFDLPRHIKEMQKKTLKQKRCSSKIYACAYCKQIRGFVVDTNTASKNAWACGNFKVMLDDTSGDLFCARKVEKHGNHARASNRRQKRNYWKSIQTTMCRGSKLIEYEMLGKVLEFYGHMYALCPNCACICALRVDRYVGDAFQCIHCQYRHRDTDTRRCDHCLNTTASLSSLKCKNTTVNICQSCFKQWMRMDAEVAKMDISTLHAAINEKWSKNKVKMHACTK